VIAAALQTIAVVLAGAALFLLLRAALPPERWLRRVIVAGFLGRAVAGQLLFWVSWARVPLLPELQRGGGLWFFGMDGHEYLREASTASANGLEAIAHLSSRYFSVFFVQILAVTTWLFGAVASSALLLNLFCYVASATLLLRWSRREPSARLAVGVAVTFLSVSPSFLLWSLQPLKDALFQLLCVAFVYGCAAWQHGWTTRTPWRMRTGTAISLLLLLAAISAIRWYVGAALLFATALFLVLTSFRSRERRRIALVCAAALALALSQIVRFSANRDATPSLAALLTPATTIRTLAHLPPSLARDLALSRDRFNAAGGRTMIEEPRRSPNDADSSAVVPFAVTEAPAHVAAVHALLTQYVESWNGRNAERLIDTFDDSENVELRASNQQTLRGAVAIEEWCRAAMSANQSGDTIAFSAVRVTVLPSGSASADTEWESLHRGRSTTGHASFLLIHRSDGWKILRQVSIERAAAKSSSHTAAISPGTPRTENATAPSKTPQERKDRRSVRVPLLLTGLAACVLPRAVGEQLGVFRIGGGGGMFWLADLDTLLFDLALVFAIGVLVIRRARAFRDPLVWLLLTLTLLLAVPLVYSVSNYGSLFRLRGTLNLCVLLVPVAAAAAREKGA
jgi:hypothetical protein